jgi:hypothetical protein
MAIGTVELAQVDRVWIPSTNEDEQRWSDRRRDDYPPDRAALT